MEQYDKLFSKAEIEYTTPFLKLWMSFNNWYKKDLKNVKTDRDAINEYKKLGKVKDTFLRLLDLRSDKGLEFGNTLHDLVLALRNYNLKDTKSKSVNYLVEPDNLNSNLILENADRRGGKEPIYISSDKKRFQILTENKELFFEHTLEIIYQVRCNLFHGSFDIESPYFLNLVESSYKILYPIMEEIILQNIEEQNHDL